MFDISAYPHADAVSKAARLSQADYERLYRQSIEDPDAFWTCLLYTSPSPRDGLLSRMPSSA